MYTFLSWEIPDYRNYINKNSTTFFYATNCHTNLWKFEKKYLLCKLLNYWLTGSLALHCLTGFLIQSATLFSPLKFDVDDDFSSVKFHTTHVDYAHTDYLSSYTATHPCQDPSESMAKTVHDPIWLYFVSPQPRRHFSQNKQTSEKFFGPKKLPICLRETRWFQKPILPHIFLIGNWKTEKLRATTLQKHEQPLFMKSQSGFSKISFDFVCYKYQCNFEKSSFFVLIGSPLALDRCLLIFGSVSRSLDSCRRISISQDYGFLALWCWFCSSALLWIPWLCWQLLASLIAIP